jgi:hypothetical protein
MRSAARTLAAAGSVIALAGCGDEEPVPAETSPSATTTSTTAPRRELPRVECPPGAVECKSAAGTIVFVERVDPDGDGDAHFVLASREGITAPGVSVIAVRADLRPQPLPGPGDLLAGAGPVFEGSFGQRQIEADEIAFERIP